MTGRLQALADANALAQRHPDQPDIEHSDLEELIGRVLLAHDKVRSSLKGPALSVGERAANNLALALS